MNHARLAPGSAAHVLSGGDLASGPPSSPARRYLDGDERRTRVVATMGDRVALGDGGVALVAESRKGNSVMARVVAGGRVQGRPGVTAPSSRLSLRTPARTTDEAVDFGVQAVRDRGYVRPGDVVVVLAGSLHDPEPVTDTLRLVRIY